MAQNISFCLGDITLNVNAPNDTNKVHVEIHSYADERGVLLNSQEIDEVIAVLTLIRKISRGEV